MVSDATETPRRKAVLHRAGQWAARVHKGTPFDVVVGIGLVTYGFVYLLVAAIAVRIAVTGQRGADTPYAALDALAETEVGEAMLWVTAFGLCALTLWQVFETVWRRDPHENPLGKAFGRFGTIATALGYLALAISAVRIAAVGRAAREGRTSPPVSCRASRSWPCGSAWLSRVSSLGCSPSGRATGACGDASSTTCEMAPRAWSSRSGRPGWSARG